MEAIAWVLGVGIAIGFLFVFPRKMLILIGVLAVGGLATWLYWFVTEQRQRARDAKLEVSAVVDRQRCPAGWPIAVTFWNTGPDRLMSASFDLQGYRKGYSGNVLTAWLSTDKILESNDRWISCWAVPWEVSDKKTDPDTLLWRVVAYPRWES